MYDFINEIGKFALQLLFIAVAVQILLLVFFGQ